jgi:hypothetical protein
MRSGKTVSVRKYDSAAAERETWNRTYIPISSRTTTTPFLFFSYLISLRLQNYFISSKSVSVNRVSVENRRTLVLAEQAEGENRRGNGAHAVYALGGYKGADSSGGIQQNRAEAN